MGKRKDPPKDAGGREHQVLPASRGGGIASVADESNWAMHDLPPGKTVGVGMGTHLDQDSAWAASAWRGQEPQRVERITVGTANSVVSRACLVLGGLSPPNDWDQAQRDLFDELIRTVKALEAELAKAKDQHKLLAEDVEALKKIKEARPFLREVFLTFTAGAGAVLVASSGSYWAGYTAGFMAGYLHDTFSPDSLCLMT